MKKLNIMKNYLKLLAPLFVLLIFLTNCKKDEIDNTETDVLGTITVDLDANKSHLRSQEALLGNIITDAYKEYTESKGKTCEFVVVNSGSIRFDAETRAEGIYPSGDYTLDIIKEIFPWSGSTFTIVEVTGSELKSIFERSVSSLPDEHKGWFLQVSKEIKVVYDLSKTAQVIDDVTNPENPVIITEGERVHSIKINSTEYNPTSVYSLLTTTWISTGEDGYVTFYHIQDTKKTLVADCECEMNEEALALYIQTHTPITPQNEDRITFVSK